MLENNPIPWLDRRATLTAAEVTTTWDHNAHSPNCSIAKAKRLLGYRPRDSLLAGLCEAVQWLVQDGQIQAAGKPPGFGGSGITAFET